MTVPPQRDLPPGRLEARRRHLLAEIRERPRASRWRVLAPAAGVAALAAAIAVPLSVTRTPKPRVEVVYRPMRVIVVAPRSGSLSAVESLYLRSGRTMKARTPFERLVAGLAAEGRRVRAAPRAHPTVTQEAALGAIRPVLRGTARAWLVRLRVDGRWRLVWLFAAPDTCVPSYGPTGGVYRTTLAGFVDASSGRPLFAITVGGSRVRSRC
jgi:hypothetical protein